MSPVWVFGAGGHAKVVIDTLRATRAWEVVGLLDDNHRRWGMKLLGVQVKGAISGWSIARFEIEHAVIAVGSNSARAEIVRRLTQPVSWISAVHPTACLGTGTRLGAGTVVCAGVCIQPDAVIGDHAIVNTMSSVDHDGVVGDFAHVGPGVHLGGNVTIGEGALLGVGSCVVHGCVVHAWSVVGAGAAVVTDIPPGVTAKGVPARCEGG